MGEGGGGSRLVVFFAICSRRQAAAARKESWCFGLIERRGSRHWGVGGVGERGASRFFFLWFGSQKASGGVPRPTLETSDGCVYPPVHQR